MKLEGSGQVGERFVGMVGVRDPYTIGHIDAVIGVGARPGPERFGDAGYQLHYTVYGRDGVMGELEPLRHHPGHELCIVVQAIAPTKRWPRRSA